MADKITSTKSAEADPNKEVNDALDKAKDAMVKAGMPADQADAMLNAARPSGGGGVVGNYADLQRMGAIAQTGVLPTPPGEDDVETDDITEAFTVTNPATVDADENPSDPTVKPEGNGDMTKAEIQAELDRKGIEYPSSATKAELAELLG